MAASFVPHVFPPSRPVLVSGVVVGLMRRMVLRRCFMPVAGLVW